MVEVIDGVNSGSECAVDRSVSVATLEGVGLCDHGTLLSGLVSNHVSAVTGVRIADNYDAACAERPGAVDGRCQRCSFRMFLFSFTSRRKSCRS